MTCFDSHSFLMCQKKKKKNSMDDGPNVRLKYLRTAFTHGGCVAAGRQCSAERPAEGPKVGVLVFRVLWGVRGVRV